MDLSTEKTQPQGLGQGIAAKSAALGQFNRLKHQFLTELVHELKSPLTAIIGLSTRLSRTCGDK
jgi:signal transduction histidine kinase